MYQPQIIYCQKIGSNVIGNTPVKTSKALKIFQDSLNRESMALGILIISIIIYGTRVRDGGYLLWLVENLLFAVAVLIFPWRTQLIRDLLVGLLALWCHGLIMLLLFYPHKADIFIAIQNISLISKCIVMAALLSEVSPQKLYLNIYVASIFIVIAQFVRLLLVGINWDVGFSGSIGDRNYFSALLVFLLVSVGIIRHKINFRDEFDLLYSALQISIFFLVIISTSRSGLLSIFWLLLMLHKRLYLFLILIFGVLLYSLGYMDAIAWRVAHSISGSDDRIRIVQYLAFMEAFKSYPLALITGFGSMASSHLTWFSFAFGGEDLTKYLYILHNSTLDLVLSFGLGSLWVIFKFYKIFPWQIMIFLLLATSFNNMLCFMPLYLFIGIALSVYKFDQRPNDQFKSV